MGAHQRQLCIHCSKTQAQCTGSGFDDGIAAHDFTAAVRRLPPTLRVSREDCEARAERRRARQEEGEAHMRTVRRQMKALKAERGGK